MKPMKKQYQKPHEKETQDCLAIVDNPSALACLKKVVSRYSTADICKPRLVLLVGDNCGPCEKEIKLHEADIASGIIQKIRANSPEGRAITIKNKLPFTPSLVLLDCHNNLIMPKEESV